MGIRCCAVLRACNNVRMYSNLRLASATLIISAVFFLDVAPAIAATSQSNLICPALTRSLKRGSSGADVTRLQKFLAQDPGVYPEGQIAGNFGALTEAAVKRWQVKFNIMTSGTPDTTGFGAVGARTMAAMEKQCMGSPGVASIAAPSVGGMLSVSPVSGNAPLNVSIQVIVNTANVCGGAIYDLDYGDGSIQSQIPVSALNCKQVTKVYSHKYLKTGALPISLVSGSHRATVTLNVH